MDITLDGALVRGELIYFDSYREASCLLFVVGQGYAFNLANDEPSMVNGTSYDLHKILRESSPRLLVIRERGKAIETSKIWTSTVKQMLRDLEVRSRK